MKLRVYNMINFRPELDYYHVESLEEALTLIDNLANAQLKNPAITDNSFGLEMYNEDDQEWENWMDDEGYEVEDYELVNGEAKMTKWA